MRRLSLQSWFRWLLSEIAAPLDLRLKDTAFAPSKMGVDFPLCYLTTTGRRSGDAHTIPLFYATVGDVPVIAATNWGTSNHPGWSYNLDAQDSATLEIEGNLTEVVATLLPDSETIPVWDELIEIWPAYAQYREIAPRDIKVYALNPA